MFFFIKSHDHTTNYSIDFNPIDVKDAVRSKSFKPENDSYQIPIEKLDGLTVTMVKLTFWLQFY